MQVKCTVTGVLLHPFAFGGGLTVAVIVGPPSSMLNRGLVTAALLPEVRAWAEEYAPIHQVAHWDDRQRKSARSYDRAYEDAAQSAEKLLALAGTGLAPKFLEHFPTLIWEDQDECLEVRPEDVPV